MIIGNAQPYVTFGLSTTLTYKEFDLGLNFRGQIGGLIFNETRYFYENTRGVENGDYNVIVLAPASVQEMADFVDLAFNLAFKYRNPDLTKW